MSYYMLSGLGGLGQVQWAAAGYGGFGATEINADAIWSDCLAGSAGNAAAGKRCGQAVQMGLNELGYGPLATDGQIGNATIAAIKKFGVDNGLGPLTWPTKAMVIKMAELLHAGAKPGPGPAVLSHVVGGEVVPGAAGGGVAKAGMSTGMMIGIGALVIAGVAGLALVAKKKDQRKA